MAHHSFSRSDSPKFARRVLERTISNYAACQSYLDEGEAITEFIHADKQWTSTQPFSTAFVRPSHFRFEFRSRYRKNEEWERYIVWQGGESVLTWWSIRPEVKTQPNLMMAIAGATGVSSGSAITIPSLLMPDVIGSKDIASLTDLELSGEEQLAGIATYRISGTRPSRQIDKPQQSRLTFWVDIENLLVLQTFSAHQFEDFKAENTIAYRPRMNVTVSPGSLAFEFEKRDN